MMCLEAKLLSELLLKKMNTFQSELRITTKLRYKNCYQVIWCGVNLQYWQNLLKHVIQALCKIYQISPHLV